MTDPTPLTEQEKERMTAAAKRVRDEHPGMRVCCFDKGYLAARDFYSDRERALREALKFYAQESNHMPEWIGSEATGSSSSAVSRDKGQCARAALEASE